MDGFLAVYVCWTSLTAWSTRCPSSRQRASWVKADRSPLGSSDCAGVVLTLLCLFRKQETTTSSAGGTSSLALTCCGYWTSWPSGSTPGPWWDWLATLCAFQFNFRPWLICHGFSWRIIWVGEKRGTNVWKDVFMKMRNDCTYIHHQLKQKTQNWKFIYWDIYWYWLICILVFRKQQQSYPWFNLSAKKSNIRASRKCNSLPSCCIKLLINTWHFPILAI